MTQFTVNGKVYITTELEFKDICKMERNYNVSFANLENKSFNAITAFFAMSANIRLEEAEKRIQEHVVNGGDFNDIVVAMNAAMEESHFFQALQKSREAKETPQIEQEEMKPIDVEAVEI